MKKQLTMFAAAAMLASFATAAFAATANVTLSGKFLYQVEYNISSSTWTDKAAGGVDNVLDYPNVDNQLNVGITTTGDPNIGGITLTLWQDGAAVVSNPNITLTGGLFGGTLKLGQVAGNWDALTGGTDGAGAAFTKTVGAISFDVVTAAPALAGRVGVKLSDTASVYGGAAVDAKNAGTMFAGGAFKFGPADVTGKFAAELGEGDNGTGLMATATIKPVDTLTLAGTIIKADKTFADAKFADRGAVAKGDNDFGNIGWAAVNFPDAANLKVRADYVAIKDVMSPWAEYKMYTEAAVDPATTAEWVFKAGTNFAPIFLSSASVSMNSLEVTEYVADFNKTVAGVGVEVKGALKTDAVADTSDHYAWVKGSKSFGFLSTWASFGIHDYGQTAQAKVGASASVSF